MPRCAYSDLVPVLARSEDCFFGFVAGGSVALAVSTRSDAEGGIFHIGHPVPSLDTAHRFWHTRAGYAALLEFLGSRHIVGKIRRARRVVWSWELPQTPTAHHSRAMTSAGFLPCVPSVAASDRPSGNPEQRFFLGPAPGAGARDAVREVSLLAVASWCGALNIRARVERLSWADLEIVRERRDVETAWTLDPLTGRLDRIPGQVSHSVNSVEYDVDYLRRKIPIHTHPEAAFLRSYPSGVSSMLPSSEDLALLLSLFLAEPGCGNMLPVSLVASPEGLYTVAVSHFVQRAAVRRGPCVADWDVSCAAVSRAIDGLSHRRLKQFQREENARMSGVVMDSRATAMFRKRLAGLLPSPDLERVVAVQLSNSAELSSVMHHYSSWSCVDLALELDLEGSSDLSILLAKIGEKSVFSLSLQKYPDIKKDGKALVCWIELCI